MYIIQRDLQPLKPILDKLLPKPTEIDIDTVISSDTRAPKRNERACHEEAVVKYRRRATGLSSRRVHSNEHRLNRHHGREWDRLEGRAHER
jgi:hypothetical protein